MLNNTLHVCWNGKYLPQNNCFLLARERDSELFERFCSYFHRLELAILTIQKKEPIVSVVYDLLPLIWKTYHFSRKSKTRALWSWTRAWCGYLHNIKSRRNSLDPHVHRALKVFLQLGQDNLATDQCSTQLFCSTWSTWP